MEQQLLLSDVAPTPEIHPATREFSYSRLSKARECLRAWFCDYVLGIRSGDTEATRLGRTAHWILEEVTKTILAGGGVTSRKMRDFIASIAGNAPADVCLEEKVLDQARELANAGLSMLTIGQPAERVAVEQYLSVPLSPGRSLRGYVDYAEWGEGRGLIRDWKSNRVPYGPDDTKQLGIYGWMETEAHPEVKIWDVQLAFLRIKELRSGVVGPEEIAAAKAWVIETIAIVDQALAGGPEAFTPNPSHRCTFCSHAVRCPAGDSHVDPAALDDVNRLNEAIGTMLVVEGRLSVLREAIKAKLPGPVTLGDTIVGIFETPSWSLDDITTFYEVVKKAGIDPLALLQVDRERLKRFLKKAPEATREPIEALMVLKPRREFGHKLIAHSGEKEAA